MNIKDEMTVKERWLAAINMQPVDRLPFWPKLSMAYPPAQEEPFRSMTLDEIYKWIGCDMHNGISSCVREKRKKCSEETKEKDGMMKTIYRTPYGELELVQQFDKDSHSYHPISFPVKTPDDIKIMTEFFNDIEIECDKEAVEEANKIMEERGENEISATYIGESPLMFWVEWIAGIENAHFLLADCTEEVEALFDAWHNVLKRKAEIICEYCPADAVYMIENTSTTLISPSQYRQYCVPHIKEYANIIKPSGKPLILHMCGLLKIFCLIYQKCQLMRLKHLLHPNWEILRFLTEERRVRINV